MLNKKQKVVLDSDKILRREKYIRNIKLSLLTISAVLVTIYAILRVVYDMGAFTVSLDNKFSQKSGLVMYERLGEKQNKQILQANKLEFMDNISIDWIPSDINKQGEGSHNGENYIAYTFYIENQGSEAINYWYSILVDDVVKNVDEAIRVMIYRNDEKKVYAKQNGLGNAEKGTEQFYSEEQVIVKQREAFNPGEIDQFTIVIWIEGDDPNCIDAIIGGEMKMHMEITEEHVEQN